MERINDLLERYFRGETNLQEERELKIYFNGNNVAVEHQVYQALFCAFAEEKKITKPATAKPRKSYRIARWAISMSGIAAAVIFAMVWFLSPETSDTYIIISGNRINDAVYTQQYAEAKMTKVVEIFNKGMQPIQKIESFQQSLAPLQKVEEAVNMLNRLIDLENNEQLDK